eukprot:527688-Hanusia_phi.AAC.1
MIPSLVPSSLCRSPDRAKLVLCHTESEARRGTDQGCRGPRARRGRGRAAAGQPQGLGASDSVKYGRSQRPPRSNPAAPAGRAAGPGYGTVPSLCRRLPECVTRDRRFSERQRLSAGPQHAPPPVPGRAAARNLSCAGPGAIEPSGSCRVTVTAWQAEGVTESCNPGRPSAGRVRAPPAGPPCRPGPPHCDDPMIMALRHVTVSELRNDVTNS